jgi:hypothetical protein
MSKSSLLLFTLFASSVSSASSNKVQLIVDTDLGFDVDDVGALAVANHLADIGKCDILGVVHNTAFYEGIGGVDVVNDWYNRSGDQDKLRLGAYTGQWGSSGGQDAYTTTIEHDFPAAVSNYDEVPSAVDAYTAMLSGAANGSVVIASIGELTNLRDILKAEPELFGAKVKAIYYMDGGYNFGCGDSDGSGWSPWLGSTEDCDGAAQYVIEHVPNATVKQVFSLNGGDVYTGSRFNGEDGCGAGPVKEAYQIWTNYGSRPSWDPITVYLAVMGDESLWSANTAETTTVDYYGRETYDTSNTSHNMYQSWVDSDHNGDVTKLLDDLMCAAPCGAPGGEGLCGNYTLQSMKNCYGDRGDGTGSHGADDLETPADSSAGTMTLHACQALCDATDGCDGVTVRLSTAAGSDGLVDCYRKGNIDLDACDTYYPMDTWVKN